MTDPNDPNLCNEPCPRTRREALRLAAGLAALAAAGALGACGRRVRGVGTVGDPIPPDPVLRPTARSPVATGGRATPLPAGSPRIEPRAAWAKGAPKPWLADQMAGIRRITIHHDGIHPPPSGDYATAAARLESIRRGHLNHGWADIGYHYSIDPSGRVWECRPLHLQGAHVKDQNPHNLGIMVMGDFDRSTPTAAAQNSLRALIAGNMTRYGIRPTDVRTHQEMAPTACPGRSLQSVMNGLRSGGALRV